MSNMVISDTSAYSIPIQKAVEQMNAVLRGVDERYFPSIRFVKPEVTGNTTVLYYIADGKGFSIGIVLGYNGDAVGLLLVTDNKQQIGPVSIVDADSIRKAVDMLGKRLSKGRS